MKWDQILPLPDLASVQGLLIDKVIGYVHILMLVLLLGWGAFFIYTLVRFRATRNPKANHDGVKNHFSTYVEVGVVVAEVMLLVGLSIPFWSNVVRAYPDPKTSVEVRVVAQQFAWNVHYPGADGIFGRTDSALVNAQTNPIGLDHQDPHSADDFTTVNTLNLPTGKPALIHLSSLDVIHSFGLPHMRLKQDVIPGMSTTTWFEPTKTGQYEIMCAQLCGIGHYRMRGVVNVMEPAAYQDWLVQQGAQAKAHAAGGADDFWS